MMATYEFSVIGDNIIRLSAVGYMDDETAHRFQKDLAELMGSSKSGKWYILMVADPDGKMSNGARRAFSELNKDPRIHQAAVVGEVNRFTRVAAGFILKASGRDNVRFFKTEAEALTWFNA